MRSNNGRAAEHWLNLAFGAGRVDGSSKTQPCWIMSYDEELPGCFSEPDLYLAVHPPEQQRAFAWLAALRERATTWSEIRIQIEAYLRERDATPFHILDQIDRAAVLFKPWLYGPDDDE